MFQANQPLSPSEREALLIQFYNDPVDFMQTCLDRWFYEPMSWVHRGFIALITKKTRFLSKYGDLDKILKGFVYRKIDPWNESEETFPIFQWGDESKTWLTFAATRFLEIMMPRGIGKTTLTEGCCVWLGCFKEKNFPMLIGETATHAENIQRNIRNEFEVNEKIKLIFGDLSGKSSPNHSWNDQQFELLNGFAMACTGRGGQVRGRNIKGQRPDLIILDDVEDKESVSTQEQLKKTREWFSGDVLPAMGEIGSKGDIILCGTLLSNEALLVTLGKDPSFTTVVFGALDPSGAPLFSAYMTPEKLAVKKGFYERMGQLDIFYLEYFNRISDESTRALKTSYIQYGLPQGQLLALALAVDPAISKKKEADDTAFGLVGLYPGCHLGILQVEGFKGMTPQETILHLWTMRKQILAGLPKDPEGAPCIPVLVGIESVAYQEALFDLLREKQALEEDWFQVEKIKFNTEKKARILGTLEPRYKAGLLHHQKQFGVYESQMKDFPKGHDDQLDVVSMAIHLLGPLIQSTASVGIDSQEEDIYTDYDTPICSGGL